MTIKYLDSKRIRGSSTGADKKILKFTGNGTFTPTEAFSVEYLVIGGGAGAAVANGGGGGAGAYRTASITTAVEAYTIVVGAGSAGATDGNFPTNGAASSLNSSSLSIVTSDGGAAAGRGGQNAPSYSGNGSGGGAGNGSSGSDGGAYGNNGGDGTANDNAAGGGGSAGNGADGATNGGAGGIGTASSITGSSLYDSGGGGGAAHCGSGGAGGSSVGGAGISSGSGNNAVENTGSGGGGGTSGTGGNGSDGVVILSFDASKGYSTTGTVAATTTTQDDKATLVDSNMPASDANWTTVTALTADTSTATPTNLDTASWDCNGADGDTTKISLTGGQIFPKDSSFTFSTWIKPDSKQTFCILDDDGGTDSVVIFAAAGGDAVEYKVWKDASTHSGGEATFSGGFAAGSWYNVVCTFDKDTGTTESYVNYSTNVNSDTEAGVTTVATNTSWKMIGNSSETYGGLMLESAIWNKVLTANERRDLYYGGSGGSGGSAGAGKKANTIASANLVCYWDGSDITAPITNQSTLVKTKIPENTLFEETDTYKTWWLQSSKWIPMPTYSGVDSTWQQTDAGADFTIDTANNEVDYHNQVNANNVYFDLNSIQTLSTSKWLIRYAVTQTGTSSGGNGNTSRIFHGVSKTGVTD